MHQKAAIQAVVVFCVMTTSCSIFDTRDPEDPGSTTVPVFIQPNQPQDVVQNLINSVRAVNINNYRRCLSTEEFEYQPAAAAQSNNPELWQGWGSIEEDIYFNNIRSETEGRSGHDLTFEDGGSYISLPPDEEQFEANYVIVINHNRDDLPEEGRGRIRLIMARDENGLLSIRSWTDESNGGDFTWSDFRAAFR